MQTPQLQILQGVFVSEPDISSEAFLQERWSRIPLNSPLPFGSSGASLTVLSRGVWNLEAGPDFLGAKLELAGKRLRGDVEVHKRSSDWLRHGHQNDPAYSNVILHVVETDDSPIESRVRIPCFVLPEGQGGSGSAFAVKGRCALHFSSLSPERLRLLFRDAGIERLRLKAKGVLADMIATGAGPAFLKRLFDAAGFKRNRSSFAVLLRRYLEYPEDMRRQSGEAILWGESGLLPDPAAARLDKESEATVKKIWDAWWPLRRQDRPPMQWKSSGSRPFNSPERRLASICALLARLGENPLPAFAERLRSAPEAGAFTECAIESLASDDPFWNLRTSFEAEPLKKPAASTGRARALELAVDVLMPSLLAFAELNSDMSLGSKVNEAYLALPATAPNRTFTNALGHWFLCPERAAKALRDAASRQGVLHIRSSYCEKVGADCSACLLFNSI